mmetsp:Transcript_25990/g.87107  ORF Transcript_25990/g.87107 Transcript_25990/m.87107 type:complete len:204 (+) Transcript_25990:557-1168(+)
MAWPERLSDASSPSRSARCARGKGWRSDHALVDLSRMLLACTQPRMAPSLSPGPNRLGVVREPSGSLIAILMPPSSAVGSGPSGYAAQKASSSASVSGSAACAASSAGSAIVSAAPPEVSPSGWAPFPTRRPAAFCAHAGADRGARGAGANPPTSGRGCRSLSAKVMSVSRSRSALTKPVRCLHSSPVRGSMMPMWGRAAAAG